MGKYPTEFYSKSMEAMIGFTNFYYYCCILEYNVAVFITNQMTADPGATMT